MPYTIRGASLVPSPVGEYATWSVARKHLRGQHDQGSHGNRYRGSGTGRTLVRRGQARADGSALFERLTTSKDARLAHEAGVEETRKQLGQHAYDGLDSMQEQSLRMYSGTVHEQINASLRAGISDDIVTEFLRPHLDTAIATSKAPANVTVYRGVSADLASTLTKGAEFVDKGYGSTSTSSKVAEGFTRMTGAVLVLNVPKGHQLFPLTRVGHPEEREYLLPRGTRYKVTAVKHDVEGSTGRGTYINVSVL